MGTRYHLRNPGGDGGRKDGEAASSSLSPPPGFGPLDSLPAGTGKGPTEEPALKTTDSLRPGERGTKRLVAEFGDRLVCVRYRCDATNRKRYKTVELIVTESDWDPPPGPDDFVHVRIAWAEDALRQRVKDAGGRWRPRKVSKVCERSGYHMPLICTPEELMGGQDDV